ncbi:MAG: helix-turn-helix transcriptional regulator [Acidobacteriota bacterium]
MTFLVSHSCRLEYFKKHFTSTKRNKKPLKIHTDLNLLRRAYKATTLSNKKKLSVYVLSDMVTQVNALEILRHNPFKLSVAKAAFMGEQMKREKLSDFVRRAMNERSLTFRQVAARSGGVVSHGTINKIVNGHQEDLEATTLIGLAKGLGVPSEQLLAVIEGKGPKTQEEAEDQEIAALFHRYKRLKPEDKRELRSLIQAIDDAIERRLPDN